MPKKTYLFICFISLFLGVYFRCLPYIHKPGYKHLIEADSYYYLGLTKNIMEQGSVSSIIKNGTYYNPLMLAPLGNYYYFDLHPYVGLTVHKIVSVFDKSASLVRGVSFTPLFLTLVAFFIFIIFLYMENIRAIPALIGSMFFLAAPIFFQRSLFGLYDTDVYNIIFPSLAIILLFYIYKEDRPFNKRILFTAILSIITGIYAMFWSGWMFIIVSAIVYYAFLIIYELLQDKKLSKARETLICIAAYLIVAAIIITILRGYGGLIFSLKDTLLRLSKFINRESSLWPDAFLTVNELKKPSLQRLVFLSGGKVFFIVSIIHVLLLIFKKKDTYKGIILFSFILIPFLLSLNAERFTILLVPPLSFAFTLFVNNLYATTIRWLSDNCHCEARSAEAISFLRLLRSLRSLAMTKKGFIAILFLSSALIPINSSKNMALRRQAMIYDDAWDRVMAKIRNSTPEDSIIDAWWPPGHFITGMARRKVLYDGATLEKEAGFWISRVFTSEDESSAIGILRMLNASGGNTSYEFLLHKDFILSKSISIINTIATMPKDEAEKYLNNYLNKIDVATLLSYTHSKPYPSYLLIYEDLVERAPVLFFISEWDFKKAENPGNVYYEKIPSIEIRREGDIIYFINGLWVNIATKGCDFIDNSGGLKGKIKSILYLEDDKIKEKPLASTTSKLSVLLINNNGRYSTLLGERKVINSLILKLYYFKGKGMKFFKPFIIEENPTTFTKIHVYEIKYENFE